jgi:hypothetical protein
MLGVGQEIPLVGDFNGDGADDIIIFVRDTKPEPGRGDVGVALSDRTRFGPLQQWADSLCVGQQIPVIGDFNGDRRDDVAVCDRDSGAVWVALNQGDRFGQAEKWHDGLCFSEQIPVAGDADGDGRDDIVVFVREHPARGPNPYVVKGPGEVTKYEVKPVLEQAAGSVLVGLSRPGKPGSFEGPLTWHDNFCRNEEIPLVADLDGDRRADIVTFCRGRSPSVWAALSNGSSFGVPAVWHNDFCPNNEVPAVGDVDGDGRADIISFVRDERPGDGRGDVYVSLSRGGPPVQAGGIGALLSGFGRPAILRHGWFCVGQELPLVGDFNGDRKADLATFIRDTQGEPARGDAYVTLSTFGQNQTWDIRVKSMYCVNNQEGGSIFVSAGDEPYLVVMSFRSKFNTPGSTQVNWGGALFEAASNFTSGGTANISASMGTVSLPNVESVTFNSLLGNSHIPEVMGAIVVGMESDGSPWGDVGGYLRQAQEALRQTLVRLVESRPLPMDRSSIDRLASDAQSCAQEVMNAMQPSFLQGLGSWLSAGGDPDDFIGFHAFLFMGVDPELGTLAQLPAIPGFASVGPLAEQHFSKAAGNPITVTGDGARYELDVDVMPRP